MSRIGQKFAIGDFVKEAGAFGIKGDNFPPRKGVVNEVFKEKNSRGHEHYHYLVTWEGHTSPTKRAQHRLSAL
tara:strand:+ start:10747 stop:10965 length:219 start_codon:yes stop_codon:yes gene_type:complete